MFNKKNKQISSPKKLNLEIETIPDIFYGGSNPTIYKENDFSVGDRKESIKAKARFNKKQKMIFGIIFFVLLVGAVSFFVVYDYLKENFKSNLSNIGDINKNILEENIIEEVLEIEEVIEEPEIEEEAEEIVEEEKEEFLFLNFPPIILANTADTDGDELTDLEEEVFALDSGAWDTDLDSYYDGQEVINLYNPKGFAPVKIVDSGLVSEYTNPFYSYRIYFPQVWEKAEVDNTAKQVIFSSITGDFVSLSVFEKQNSETFYDFFAKKAQGQKASDLISFINRFDYKAMSRYDGLVYYFEDDKNFYVLLYNPRDFGPIKYRSIFKMMAQSFRSSALNSNLNIDSVQDLEENDSVEETPLVEDENPDEIEESDSFEDSII